MSHTLLVLNSEKYVKLLKIALFGPYSGCRQRYKTGPKTGPAWAKPKIKGAH